MVTSVLTAWMVGSGGTDVYMEFEYNERSLHLSHLTYGVDQEGKTLKKKKKKKKIKRKKSHKGSEEEFTGPKKKIPLQKLKKVEKKPDNVSFSIYTTVGPPIDVTASSKEECTEWIDKIDIAIKAWGFSTGATLEDVGEIARSGSNRNIADLVNSSAMFMGGANTFGKTLGRKKKGESFQRGSNIPPPPKKESFQQATPEAVKALTKQSRIAKPTSIRKKELNLEPSKNGPRNAVMPVLAIDEEEIAGQVKTKDNKTYRMLRETLDDSTTLAHLLFSDFDDAAIDEIVNKLYRMETTANQLIMKQGDIGDKFYVIQKGKFALKVKFNKSEDDDDDEEAETTLNKGPGGFFGELSLLYDSPAPFTVTSSKDGLLWVINRREFLQVTKHLAERQQLRKIQFLNSVDLFGNNLSESEIQQLADALDYKFLTKGDLIMEPGANLAEMLFVSKGSVDMYSPNSEDPVATLYEGETFGEFALLEPCAAEFKLVAAAQKTALLSLNLEECEGLLGPIRDVVTARWRNAFATKMTNAKQIMQEEKKMLNQTIAHAKKNLTLVLDRNATKATDVADLKLTLKSGDQVKDSKVEGGDKATELVTDQPWEESPPLLPNIEFSDLEPLTVLGQGSFGKVFLVRDKGTEPHYILDRTDNEAPKLFALKIMARNFIVTNGWEEKADNEILAMAELSYHANSPFILQLYHTWTCPKNIYFLLEYGEGGDLYGMMKVQDDYCFTEKAARYYIASVVNAFDVFHQRGICFRDLKPENLILNRFGHLKLADLGLAKKTTRTYTICGTPDYMAPEILRGRGHDKAVDWWALGVLVYELHTGLTPFYGDTPDKIYELILAHESPMVYTDEPMSKAAKSLASKLLEPKRTRRLGNLKDGAEGIRQHRYFKKFSWDDHAELKTKPPIVPLFDDVTERDHTVNAKFEEDDTSSWKPKVNTHMDKTPKI